MSDLSSRQCVPCRGGVPALEAEEIEPLLDELDGWVAVGNHHLRKEYKFCDFREAHLFVDRVGALADEQGHHPEIAFGWAHAEIEIWTHKIDGLTESDFILAAKIDRMN